MAHPFAGIALHTWTLDSTELAGALAAAAAAGFDAIELRRLDFSRSFERGLADAQVLDLVRGSGLAVSAVGVEYGWMFAQGAERERLFGVFRASCENAVALGCPLLMSAIGPGDATLDVAVANVREAGAIAAAFGMRLALEYQFQHPVVSRLEVLRDIIARAGCPNVGLLLDAYHLQRGGYGGRGFAAVPASEIAYFQFSDVPDAAPDRAPPTDRLPPGAGVVHWTEVFRLLAEKNYTGFISYEGPNPAQWARPPATVAREAIAATRRALAAAFP